MWLVLRSRNQTTHNIIDLLIEFSSLTNKNERTIRKWIKAGEGIFWNVNNQKLSMVGKNKVFAHFNIEKPGKVLLTDQKNLLGSLQKLRGILSSCWMNRKEKNWASRETITKLTGRSHQTQINHDKVINQKSDRVFCDNWEVEKGERKQMPNIYYTSLEFFSKNRFKNTIRYGLYSLENKNSVNDNAKPEPVLVESINKARKFSKKYNRQMFTYNGKSEYGIQSIIAV